MLVAIPVDPWTHVGVPLLAACACLIYPPALDQLGPRVHALTRCFTAVCAARCCVLSRRALQEVLAETGQEVPGWLGNIAQRHAPYGQKSRRGGGRFGGRDFRKDFGGHNNCECHLSRCSQGSRGREGSCRDFGAGTGSWPVGVLACVEQPPCFPLSGVGPPACLLTLPAATGGMPVAALQTPTSATAAMAAAVAAMVVVAMAAAVAATAAVAMAVAVAAVSILAWRCGAQQLPSANSNSFLAQLSAQLSAKAVDRLCACVSVKTSRRLPCCPCCVWSIAAADGGGGYGGGAPSAWD